MESRIDDKTDLLVDPAPQQSKGIAAEDVSETEGTVGNLSCEIDRYFKLGEILAHTECLASNLQLTNQPSPLENISHVALEDELDPHSTYFYLGNIYAELPQRFPRN